MPLLKLLIVFYFASVSSYPGLPDLTGIKGTTTLPRADENMATVTAVSQPTGEIYIIGGNQNPQQLITFNAFTKEFTDKGTYALLSSIVIILALIIYTFTRHKLVVIGY